MNNKIIKALKVMDGMNIKEFTKQEKLEVISTKDLDSNEDGCLIENKIFVRKNLERYYRRFVILHEIGHHIMHREDSLAFSYSFLGHRNKIEVEADNFACMKLLEDIDLENVDILDLLQRKGVPLKIAIRFIEMYKRK
ncbi:MAG: ImmA/IrrE family metallo-endopeptidase [Bacteroidales bacterium]